MRAQKELTIKNQTKIVQYVLLGIPFSMGVYTIFIIFAYISLERDYNICLLVPTDSNQKPFIPYTLKTMFSLSYACFSTLVERSSC